MSSTESEDANRMQPHSDTEEPIRVMDRSDKWLPMVAKSNTDMEDPTMSSPTTDMPDPKRAKYRSDNELPIWPFPKTDTEEPHREKLLRARDEPR